MWLEQPLASADWKFLPRTRDNNVYFGFVVSGNRSFIIELNFRLSAPEEELALLFKY